MEKTDILKTFINRYENIVFFGGAGVSTESGLPDFRSKDGLYNQKYDYPPEVILSHDFYESHPEEFFRFYREKLLVPGIKPNRAHYALAKLEACGKLRCVVTQNIDGLHQAAGSKNVLELHGSVLRNHCEVCGREYGASAMAGEGIPKCACGGRIKPDVVLYGESLDMDILTAAVKAISECEMLIVAGTSLTVYPAAGLTRYFRGEKLVLINRDATAQDDTADLVLRESVGKVLSEACSDV